MNEPYLALAKIRILTNYAIFLFRFSHLLGVNGKTAFDELNNVLKNEMEKLTTTLTEGVVDEHL